MDFSLQLSSLTSPVDFLQPIVMASYLQPVFEAVGLGDPDTRKKILYTGLFIASIGAIHYLGMSSTSK